MRPHLLLVVPASARCSQLACWPRKHPAGPDYAGPRYVERFGELKSLDPDPTRCARCMALTLRRDVATLVLEDGTLQLFRPIGGQVMIAAFRGKGHITLCTPTRIEQERLRLFRKSPEVRESFETALSPVRRHHAGRIHSAGDLRSGRDPSREPGINSRHGWICSDNPEHDWLDPDVLRPFLNGEQTGLFYAYLSGTSTAATRCVFAVDPHEVEAVRVLVRRRAGGILGETFAEVATQFRRQGDSAPAGEFAERRPEGRIRKYTMQIRLPESGSGELTFSAAARLEIVADTDIGPWVPFVIYLQDADRQRPLERWRAGGSSTWARTAPICGSAWTAR